MEDELDNNPIITLRKYLKLLQNKFPIPQELKGINRFSSKSYNQGEYSEAIMLYHEENKLSDRFAMFVDKYLPSTWSDTDIPSFEEYCSWRDAQEDEALTLSDYDTSEEWDQGEQEVYLPYAPEELFANRDKLSIFKAFGLSDEEIKKLI